MRVPARSGSSTARHSRLSSSRGWRAARAVFGASVGCVGRLGRPRELHRGSPPGALPRHHARRRAGRLRPTQGARLLHVTRWNLERFNLGSVVDWRIFEPSALSLEQLDAARASSPRRAGTSRASRCAFRPRASRCTSAASAFCRRGAQHVFIRGAEGSALDSAGGARARAPGRCAPGRATMLSRELQLIINADDFGQSDDTVDATIECFEAGALTSATLMPAMPATERALEFARSHPEHGFGVHLTLSADPACASARPTLRSSRAWYDADGTLLSTREVRLRAMLGAARTAASSSGRSRPRCAWSWRPGCRSRTWTRIGTCTSSSRFESARDRPAAARDPPRARGPGRLPEPALAQPDLLARPPLGELARPRVRDHRAFLHAVEGTGSLGSTHVRARRRDEGGLARDRRAPRALGGHGGTGSRLRARARPFPSEVGRARELADPAAGATR